MFFPESMSEVELIAPSKDLLAVTKVLGNRGVFHQIDSTYLGLENLGPSTWVERAASYSTLERRIQVILQSLSLEEAFTGAPDKDMADEEHIKGSVDRIEAEVKQTSDLLAAEKKRLEQLENQLHQLEPISGTDVEVGALRKSQYMHSILGVLPAANVSRLETSLARVPHAFFTLREDPQKPVVWLLGPRSNSDIIERAAKSAYLNPLTLPEEFEGTPAQITETIRKAIDTSKKRIAEYEETLSRLAKTHSKELYDLLWDVHVSRVTADAIARFGQLRHTYVVVGWVPTSRLDALKQRLKEVSPEILIESRAMAPSTHQTNVPVALQNPGFLGAFEALVNTYARPRYEEIDPTPLIALTFPLLYGAMFGDAGQGLVLAAIGLLLSRKTTLGGLLVACGLSGAIFGLLFGSFFGFEDILPHHPFFGRFFWISPIHDVLGILQVAIAAGIVLIIFAHLLNLYNAFRARDWGRFLFDSSGLAGLALYISFLIILGNVAAGVFTGRSFLPEFLLEIGRVDTAVAVARIVFVVGLFLATIFSHPLQHWMHDGHFVVEGGWGMFIIQSLAEVLEKLISMLSNTLSYVRVGAFAIVHAGFTGAVFVIAKLAGAEGSVPYWIVVVLGNLFVIGLEGFIVTIQTMRLHYYEFFSKFFRGGGSAYDPLELATAKSK